MAATILIVEDEPPQAEMLSYNLAKEGYSVLMAENGDQAFDLLIDEHPDLIVLDWMLPDISGIEICRRLRARAETKSVPIVLLTARGEEEDRVRGIETGADDYVVKPYSPRELIARNKGLLRRSHPELSANILEYADLSMDWNVTRSLVQESNCTWVRRSSACYGCSWNGQPGYCPAKPCSIWSGVETSLSKTAPSTFTFAACAKSSTQKADRT